MRRFLQLSANLAETATLPCVNFYFGKLPLNGWFYHIFFWDHPGVTSGSSLSLSIQIFESCSTTALLPHVSRHQSDTAPVWLTHGCPRSGSAFTAISSPYLSSAPQNGPCLTYQKVIPTFMNQQGLLFSPPHSGFSPLPFHRLHFLLSWLFSQTSLLPFPCIASPTFYVWHTGTHTWIYYLDRLTATFPCLPMFIWCVV